MELFNKIRKKISTPLVFTLTLIYFVDWGNLGTSDYILFGMMGVVAVLTVIDFLLGMKLKRMEEV